MRWWWLGYVAFVVYGSLVPLDFRPAPWETAWQAFGGIRLLDVGPGGRADWVANGVLYVPVGFLTASLLAGGQDRKSPAAFVGAVGFGVVLALVVEFAQVFFPPRTVSVNDLVAELIGSVVGAALAAVAGHRFQMLLAALSGAADRLVPALLKAYVLAYCAFSLFPYDFLLSAGELAEKFGSGRWGWLWAEVGGRGGRAAAVAKLAAETLAALPLGWLLAGRGATPGRALGVGVALGVAIEFAQFFLVSGVTQGGSVLTRALGVAAGAMLWRRRNTFDPLRLAAAIRCHGVAILGLYLLALVAVTGWFELPWQGAGAAVEGLREVRFLPFYYHYYTTEQAALLSLTSVGLMYAPLGVLAWAWFMGAGAAAGMAVPIALGMEASKLFLAGLHPDPTNVLLAGVAAWLGCRLAMAAERWAVGPARGLGGRDSSGPIPAARGVGASASTVEVGGARSGAPELRWRGAKGGLQTDRPAEGAAELRPSEPVPGGLVLRAPRGLALLGLLTGVALAAWGVAGFPVQPALLGLGLAGYGVALWFRPHYLWVAVPAALPLLDLAPWSGRFFFDEFDLLLLVSLAVGYARLAPPPHGRRAPLLAAVLALVGVAYGVSALRGLLPWQALDLDAFSHYYSPFNALRIAKGALGAFLLLGLACRFAAAGADVGRLFGTGMVIGLAGTVAVVVWERAAFPGLFNFTDVYRVTGPFSQMHVGGADLEAYLTVAVAFLAHFLVTRLAWPERILGLTLLLGASYTVMVTFSRACYAGFAVALLVAAGVGLAGAVGRTWRGWLRRGATAAVLLAVSLAVALPILLSPFAQARLARVGADLALRQAHWADALAMRDPGLATRLFGMGLGRYPETHHWRSHEPRAASYRLEREGDNTFLRLGSGSPIYVEQFVATRPQQTYALSLRARSPSGAATLNVSLCEKWLLTSARCVFRTLDLPAEAGWTTLRAELVSGEVGKASWYAPRPVKLSITNANRNAVVEVDAMTLTAQGGAELLENGDFSAGLDRWYFSADVDLPWHIWSLPVAVLFEMGWLGAAALSLALALALTGSARAAVAGRPWAAAWLGALLGLGVLGAVDSLGDSPRCLLLVLFLVLVACHRRKGAARPA